MEDSSPPRKRRAVAQDIGIVNIDKLTESFEAAGLPDARSNAISTASTIQELAYLGTLPDDMLKLFAEFMEPVDEKEKMTRVSKFYQASVEYEPRVPGTLATRQVLEVMKDDQKESFVNAPYYILLKFYKRRPVTDLGLLWSIAGVNIIPEPKPEHDIMPVLSRRYVEGIHHYHLETLPLIEDGSDVETISFKKLTRRLETIASWIVEISGKAMPDFTPLRFIPSMPTELRNIFRCHIEIYVFTWSAIINTLHGLNSRHTDDSVGVSGNLNMYLAMLANYFGPSSLTLSAAKWRQRKLLSGNGPAFLASVEGLADQFRLFKKLEDLYVGFRRNVLVFYFGLDSVPAIGYKKKTVEKYRILLCMDFMLVNTNFYRTFVRQNIEKNPYDLPARMDSIGTMLLRAFLEKRVFGEPVYGSGVRRYVARSPAGEAPLGRFPSQWYDPVYLRRLYEDGKDVRQAFEMFREQEAASRAFMYEDDDTRLEPSVPLAPPEPIPDSERFPKNADVDGNDY